MSINLNTRYEYSIHYWEVEDGDTVNLLLDLGFETTHWVSSRLMGLDAPETRYLRQRSTGTLVKDVVLKWLLEAEGIDYLNRLEYHDPVEYHDPDKEPKIWVPPNRYPVWNEPFESKSELRYISSQKEKDKYGRSLGVIKNPNNDTSLNGYLLNQKIVRPYDGKRKGIWTEQELCNISSLCKAILMLY